MLSAVSVLVVDHCPAWWPQPGHPKVPGDSLCLQEGGDPFAKEFTFRQGLPQALGPERLPCHKQHLQVPSMATVSTCFLSMCVLVMPWDTCEGILDLLPVSYCPQTVTLLQTHLPPMCSPYPGLDPAGLSCLFTIPPGGAQP